jgi:alcohol dehydrogenase (cytochrome c)
MAAGDPQNTRFSSLDHINTQNVSKLRLAWSFETGLTRGHEAAPLVIGDTMYVVTPFPNMLYALDLRNKGARKWVYHPNPTPAARGGRRRRA